MRRLSRSLQELGIFGLQSGENVNKDHELTVRGVFGGGLQPSIDA
jgi:hypothetical protein